MTSKYKLVRDDKLEAMKRKIRNLTDENEELKHRVVELEDEKVDDKAITNVIEEKVHETLNDLLRDYKCPKDDRYKPYLDDDWSYDPERDGLDWSYRPKRGTTGPYPWPYAPEVGDWPPGPQVGDVPPYHLPDDYPYPCWPPYYPYGAWWGIYPPYWQFPGRNYVTTNETGNPVRQDVYTTSKTEE